MKLLGYWIESLADTKYYPPQELVTELPVDTRGRLADYLDGSTLYETYRGISWCRFGCEHASMGSREFTDGEWVWPEGLSHYIRDHGVGLPEQFISHVLAGGSKAPSPLPADTLDDGPWLSWCKRNSTRRLQVPLEKARLLADNRAKELRSAQWCLREQEIGVSDSVCVYRDCYDMALVGMAICAKHATNLDAYDPGSVAYYEGLCEVLAQGTE